MINSVIYSGWVLETSHALWISIHLCGSTRANPAASPPLVYHSEQRRTLVSVSPLFRWKGERPVCPSPPPWVFPQPPARRGYWAGERDCIDFDLNWATFMVNFTRAASRARPIHPEPIGRGEMRFFLHQGIYCSVRTTYAPPRSLWWEMMGPLCTSREWKSRRDGPMILCPGVKGV